MAVTSGRFANIVGKKLDPFTDEEKELIANCRAFIAFPDKNFNGDDVKDRESIKYILVMCKHAKESKFWNEVYNIFKNTRNINDQILEYKKLLHSVVLLLNKSPLKDYKELKAKIRKFKKQLDTKSFKRFIRLLKLNDAHSTGSEDWHDVNSIILSKKELEANRKPVELPDLPRADVTVPDTTANAQSWMDILDTGMDRAIDRMVPFTPPSEPRESQPVRGATRRRTDVQIPAGYNMGRNSPRGPFERRPEFIVPQGGGMRTTDNRPTFRGSNRGESQHTIGTKQYLRHQDNGMYGSENMLAINDIDRWSDIFEYQVPPNEDLEFISYDERLSPPNIPGLLLYLRDSFGNGLEGEYQIRVENANGTATKSILASGLLEEFILGPLIVAELTDLTKKVYFRETFHATEGDRIQVRIKSNHILVPINSQIILGHCLFRP